MVPSVPGGPTYRSTHAGDHWAIGLKLESRKKEVKKHK